MGVARSISLGRDQPPHSVRRGQIKGSNHVALPCRMPPPRPVLVATDRAAASAGEQITPWCATELFVDPFTLLTRATISNRALQRPAQSEWGAPMIAALHVLGCRSAALGLGPRLRLRSSTVLVASADSACCATNWLGRFRSCGGMEH